MAPKRRGKENETAKTVRMDEAQKDHEMFLQAFEKPTQIYRYLRTRTAFSPCFLFRTLTYMRHRMSRHHNKRKDFKVDSILGRVLAKQQQDTICSGILNYMNITFTGFHSKRHKGLPQVDSLLVETILLKLCHKKRKDVSSPVMQIPVGQSKVAYNPDGGAGNSMLTIASSVSVPSSSFNFTNGHLVKSYVLLFRVSAGASSHNGFGGNENASDVDEPASKKRKNGRVFPDEEKVFGAELVLFDKQQRCYLTDGDYELLLQEVVLTKSSPKKQSTWDSIEDTEKVLGPLDVFNWGPTLRFALRWSNEGVSVCVPLPVPLSPLANCTRSNHLNIDKTCTNGNDHPNTKDVVKKKKKLRIFYQFLYNSKTRQQTEARDDLHCPWCSLNCTTLYSLLKHLKLCHSRFMFTYVPHPKGARIDVAINECYDGSYSGNPHDLHSCPPGFAFSRNGPVRRTSVTTVTICRPKRSPCSMSEFLETEDAEYDVIRPYIVGHNRMYHHTGTCLPIRPQEINVDSEGENDPEWLQIKTNHMIDEFTDVNEGEKELMKMWNLHVMKFGYVGDCQIPLACRMFVSQRGREILERNLYLNFVLHMTNLLDFGMIGATALYQTLRQLQAVEDAIRASPPGKRSLATSAPHPADLNRGVVVLSRKKCPDPPKLDSVKPKS